MTTDATRGRVLSLTRAGIWVLLVLAAANGLFLYFVPAQAETDYAWSIKPPVNAAFIGAGFLAGTLATGLVLELRHEMALVLDAPDRALGAGELAAAGDADPQRPLQVGLPADLGVDVRVRRRAARDPVPGHAPARERRRRAARRPAPEAAEGPERDLRRAHARRRDRALHRPRRTRRALGVAADAAAGPRRRRLVRALRDDPAAAPRSACAARPRRSSATPRSRAGACCSCCCPSCTPTTSAAPARGSRAWSRCSRWRSTRWPSPGLTGASSRRPRSVDTMNRAQETHDVIVDRDPSRATRDRRAPRRLSSTLCRRRPERSQLLRDPRVRDPQMASVRASLARSAQAGIGDHATSAMLDARSRRLRRPEDRP